MPEESYQDRSEKATAKKRQEAREKGNVPRSNEVNSAVILLVSSLCFIMFGKHMFNGLKIVTHNIFANFSSMEVSVTNLQNISLNAGITFAYIIGPFMLSVMVAGVVANVLQSGITLSAHSIEPKLEKINPLSGFKRLFSLRSFVELLKNILKMAIILIVGYKTIKGEYSEFYDLTNQDIGQIIAFIGSLSLKLFLRVGVVFILLAALDFIYQKYEYEKNLKMTKQEIKEEFKQSEGDPLVKSRIRSIQRETARRRMMSEVPKADVVIVNPIHVAVALKFNSDEMTAPVVVAKGLRKVAEKIKEIARENNVPIVEKPLVARLLFKSAQVGREIPVELYQVVAEILAYVYQMKNKVSGVKS
ncbi:MAG TPA: flagellar biosynthesis protein FlhB [bacterium]|nr:flagellar biosynthesis protein FlhB [bacterium]HPN43186.1 flagellar biosynthesis protein FlhB [bacterium]